MAVSRRFSRLLAVLAFLGALLALGQAAPASQAEPLATQVVPEPEPAWEGHPSCKAQVDINVTGAAPNVGGFETRLTFNTAFASYSSGDVAISNFLSDGGQRSVTGADGTDPLEVSGSNSVKFGAYSWGTDGGADAPGTLATVRLGINKCGESTVTLNETQLVDYEGLLFGLDAPTASGTLKIHHRLNTNGDAIPVVTGQDVLAVVNALNSSVSCDADYQYNTNGDAIPVVTGQDVLAVVNALNSSVACP